MASAVIDPATVSPGTAAYLLARRLERCDREYRKQTDRLLEPFQPARSDGRPSRTAPKHAQRLGRDWRRLPWLGRIECRVDDAVAGKCTIFDGRATSCIARFPGWDRAAEALRLSARIIEIEPGCFKDREFSLLVASLHALKRRYQRSFPRDFDVLRDLSEVASHFLEVKGAGFRVPAGEGIWRCEMAELDGAPVIGVRTYVALPAAEVFTDERGALRARWSEAR